MSDSEPLNRPFSGRRPSFGFIRDEILAYFDRHKAATQEQVIAALNWPSVLITTSIGFLLQDGLLQAESVDGQLVLVRKPIQNS